jgi:hypothetical protein
VGRKQASVGRDHLNPEPSRCWCGKGGCISQLSSEIQSAGEAENLPEGRAPGANTARKFEVCLRSQKELRAPPGSICG